MDILYQGGIEMNGQIVLCKGVNDGEELERSIRDLTGYLPMLKSVSVVAGRSDEVPGRALSHDPFYKRGCERSDPGDP